MGWGAGVLRRRAPSNKPVNGTAPAQKGRQSPRVCPRGKVIQPCQTSASESDCKHGNLHACPPVHISTSFATTGCSVASWIVPFWQLASYTWQATTRVPFRRCRLSCSSRVSLGCDGMCFASLSWQAGTGSGSHSPRRRPVLTDEAPLSFWARLCWRIT